VSDAPTPSEPRPLSSSSTDNTGRPVGLDLREGGRPVPEYVLVEKLGEGGFGQVWKARDEGGFEVALKFLRLDGRAGATELRALEVMKNVRHAHVLPMFRSWQVGGWLVLALELGEKTLYQRLAEAEKQGHAGIPRRELLEYMLEAAKGLDYLHTLNIQHRDVKPQNLLLVGGTVKVGDFGLAKLLEQSLASNSGSMTVAYAAPEQFQGLVSPQTDQYSLAVSYCRLCGAGLPFRGTQHELMLGRLQGKPDLSGLAEAERPAVARALSRRPEQRWPSCRAFVEALAAGNPAPTEEEVTPPLQATTPYAKRRPRRYVVAGVALLAALAVGIAGDIIAHWDQGPPPDTILTRTGAVAPAAGEAAGTGKRLEAVPGVQPKPPALDVVRQRPPLLDCTGAAGVSAADMRDSQEAWANYLGREVEATVEIADGVKMTFVLVPPDKFVMGSPLGEEERRDDETLHTVVLTEPFDLGKFEVTQAQYRALVNRAKSEKLPDPDPSSFKGETDLPVDSVVWEKANAFGPALTKLLSDKHEYRLPTEAEWEYSCRGGRPSSQPFGVGGGHDLSSLQANFNGGLPYGGPGKANYLQKTVKVGSYEHNALGLFDMHGNVCEWCSDRYGPYPDKEVTNPAGPTEGQNRVYRGGGWAHGGKDCRAAGRFRNGRGVRYVNIGFRLARTVPSGGN
jgi:formylglycine-generating enzyme required for sulfatase activity